jgi:hypothetical protein
MYTRIPVTITTAADGTFALTTDKKYTGRFLGLHTTVGTMTTCTLTISAVTAAVGDIPLTLRTLYTKAATGNTVHIPVRVQCSDTAGSAIAAEYEHPYLMNEAIKISCITGGNVKTMDVQLLLDVEYKATHTD